MRVPMFPAAASLPAPGAFSMSAISPTTWENNGPTTKSVSVTWGASAGAATYTIYLTAATNCTMADVTGLTGTSTSVTVSFTAATVGGGTLNIKAVNATGDTVGGTPKSFTFAPPE
jgi:hypothetical protein